MNEKIKPSTEQKKIVDVVGAGKHVVVNAVAGSGKTMTLLFIAQQNKYKKILQITYNKQLKLEVKNKVNDCNLDNVEVHTYHGLAVKFYDQRCHTDDNLIKILQDNTKPRFRPSFDIIVIDETQDMTMNYYELIYKFIQDIGFKGTLLILGDSFQGVYEFKNADTRYLLLSHKLWNRNFDHLVLNKSYRVTHNIASFVNKIMIGYDRIISNKKSQEKVIYCKVNVFDFADNIFNKIKKCLLNGYRPEDFFILSPSLKSAENPGKKLENLLVSENIPVFFTRNEEEGIDEAIIANKIVFTTFHQAKGRERKIVIVFGFDESYFEYFAKEKNKMQCPSELYVAVTRASELLIVVEDYKYGPLSFLKKTPCVMKKYAFVDYIDHKPSTYKKLKGKNETENENNKKNIHKTTVKEMTMYLSEITIGEIIPLMNLLFTTTNKSDCDIVIPLTVKTKTNLTEDVSDINGIAIPAMYEAKICNSRSSLHKIVNQASANITSKNNTLLLLKMDQLWEYPSGSIQQYLLMSNLFIALNENIFSKLNQIDQYDWLTDQIIDKCHQNLEKHIGGNAKYEETITDNYKNYYTYDHDLYGKINISGRMDVVDDDTLWELKCVSSLTTEHLLQLVIYAWLWERTMRTEYGSRKYKILNIRTNEVQELKYQDHLVDEIIELILINKYDPKFKEDDDDFIEKCNKIHDDYPLYKNDIRSMFNIGQKN
jgi:AAA domain/UvrD-like helicase C-terminal domain